MLDIDSDVQILTSLDLIGIINQLIRFRFMPIVSDDIDHLGNRRIRSVGELMANQIRIGLNRLERVVRELSLIHI